MPKQKYYYAVVEELGPAGTLILNGELKIFYTELIANYHCKQCQEVVPIPADSLHKLIKEHTKKAK